MGEHTHWLDHYGCRVAGRADSFRSLPLLKPGFPPCRCLPSVSWLLQEQGVEAGWYVDLVATLGGSGPSKMTQQADRRKQKSPIVNSIAQPLWDLCELSGLWSPSPACADKASSRALEGCCRHGRTHASTSTNSEEKA